jgi:hypothetical protein
MAIYAESKGGGDYTPMESGVYVARCVQLIQVGTITESINGEEKTQHKVRFGFEFPLEKKIFKEENGEQPYFLSKEYSLYMHEKATLRKDLENWRSKKFTEEEAKKFDVTKLIGVPCTINVVHKTGKSNGRVYAEIGSISPLMKGTVCPDAINPIQILSYDSFDIDLFNSFPEFLRKKIESSVEYKAMTTSTIPESKQEFIKELEGMNEAPPF